MLITEDSSDAAYQIKAYTEHSVTINESTHNNSLIVSSNQLHLNWRPSSIEDLNAEDLSVLLEFEVDLVLLGTGLNFKMPPRTLLNQFEDKFSIEVMNTHAACRTFAILSSEGRKVAAALIINTTL